MKKMKGIILHGGFGTRLHPLTNTESKGLLPIANKPMSEYALDSLRNSGISEITIVVGGIGKEKVIKHYGNGKKFGLKISYINQSEPKGISHAINLCKEFISNEKFIVFLGDNIIDQSIKDFAKEFEFSDYDAMILLSEVDNPSQFGIAEIDEKGEIVLDQ